MNSLFFELIRVAIGTRSCLSRLPSASEWGKIYKMAQKQSLVGVCFAGIQTMLSSSGGDCKKIGLDDTLYLKWMSSAFQIQERNRQLNKQCIELQERLSADGLKCCVLKGQGVAQLYDESLHLMRQSGDIDIWVDASREKVIDYGMQISPNTDFDQKHAHYQIFPDTPVETHWIPVKRNNPRWNRILKRYFDSERERQFSHFVDGLCVPTTDFQLVHQLLHVYSHYVYEGVGMRQLMDLYFAQKACAEAEDGAEQFDKVLKLFKRLGLMSFVAAAQWVLQEVFQMPDEQLLCKTDSKEGRKLLDEIMIGGNFGQHDSRNHVKNESFLHRFFRRWGRMFRMFRFDPLGTILMPFERLKLEIWMRRVRRKYNV